MEMIIALILFVAIVASWFVLPAKSTEKASGLSADVMAVSPASRTA